MARNPLNQKGQSHEIVKGNKVINLKTQRNIVINGQEMEIEVRDSIPDGNGNYNDIINRHIHTDWAGTPIPEDSKDFLGISHTGAIITTSEAQGTCTSLFHPRNRSTFVRLGLDGRTRTNGRVICSYCQFWQTTFYIIAGLFILGIVLGIVNGAGLFSIEVDIWKTVQKIVYRS